MLVLTENTSREERECTKRGLKQRVRVLQEHLQKEVPSVRELS